MALGEDLVLLAIPPRGGRVRAADRIGFALRASVLVDLALAGRIAMAGRRIDVIDPAPTDDPRLNSALTTLCDSVPVPSLDAWLSKTPRGNAMLAKYLSILADQGAVRFEHRREHVAVAPRAELLAPQRQAAALTRLSHVARGRSAADADQALAGLVHACGLDRHLYHAPFGLAARRRLARFSQREVAANAQTARAATDATLAQAVAQAISGGLAELTRELVTLIRYEYRLEHATAGHHHSSAPGHHSDFGGSASVHHSGGGHHSAGGHGY
jgi:Golgi phosphoprotein 3 (GPP34)